jgi:hypothetical protein
MMYPEPKMTRAERRRRKRGVFPCMGCGKRQKLKIMPTGYCYKCSSKYMKLASGNGVPPPVSAMIGGWTWR